MFGYSTTKPLENKGYFHRIFDIADEMNCQIEGWHTESGPGVFEAVSFVFPDTWLGICVQSAGVLICSLTLF